MSTEAFRLAEGKREWLGFRHGESLLQNCGVQGSQLVLATEGDIRGNEVELDRVETLADFFEPLSGRASDKKGQLNSTGHGGGKVNWCWVVRCWPMIIASHID